MFRDSRARVYIKLIYLLLFNSFIYSYIYLLLARQKEKDRMNFLNFSLVFQMVETEEEYTEQMEILVSCFLRPFKMAASSKKPPCSHEDVNSIFLNSETVLFLHQIFLKGLISRMENWPTLVLGMSFYSTIRSSLHSENNLALFINISL